MSTASPATTPKAPGRPRTAVYSSPASSAAVRVVSRPTEDSTNGLNSTSATASTAAASGSRSTCTVRVTDHASATFARTYTAPTARTGWRITAVAAASSNTLSGEVAEFDGSCGISPQCPENARFRAYDSVMYASSVRLECTIQASRTATAAVPAHTAATRPVSRRPRPAAAAPAGLRRAGAGAEVVVTSRLPRGARPSGRHLGSPPRGPSPGRAEGTPRDAGAPTRCAP